MNGVPVLDFATLLQALTLPRAFAESGEGVYPTEAAPVIQTHASAVLLSPTRAYKLKKPKNFGFFDYSTPELRRHFCIQETLINSRLAPHIYLGIAPVLLSPGGYARFGPDFPTDRVPQPGAIIQGGVVIDFAVVMVRLPDEATLEWRVTHGTIRPEQLAPVARHIAAFHAETHTDTHIASFGSLEVIRGNWEENFAQMQPYIGRTLDARTYDAIATYIRNFLRDRAELFHSRVRDGRVRDCHGDLRLQHVYLLDDLESSTGSQQTEECPGQAILDGIEFNERFRYSDVASEVAFLTMELDALGRPDLSRVFIDSYIAASGDTSLRELLPFYTCYRACVRGKVTSFLLDEPEVPEAQRLEAGQQARFLFDLAASYVGGSTVPTLMLVGGLMGTGKSTLALALHDVLGWKLFSSDMVRKRLARLDPELPHADDFGQGLYSQQWTAQTYHLLLEETRAALAGGHAVLLDATFLRRKDRQAAAEIARAAGARVVFLECACPREVALQRLAQRWQARLARSPQEAHSKESAASQASDGRPDLYDAQSEAWQPCDEAQESSMQHYRLETTLPLHENIEQVLTFLHVPHHACWL